MAKMNRRADGRYCKSILDSKLGKRIYFYGKSEREVNMKIFEHQQTVIKGRRFVDVADEWWRDAYERLGPQTDRGYRVCMRRAIEEFGMQRMPDITVRDVTNFFIKLGKRGFSHSTVKNYKIVVNQIFETAILNGEIQFNPCTYAKIPQSLPRKKRTSATVADEKKIQSAENPWIFHYIALMTGLRKGEILALQWKDVDFDKSLISITKSVYYEGGTAHLKLPKTDESVRVIPLLAPLKERFLKESRSSPEHYIVSDTGEKPLSHKRFRTLEKHSLEDLGISCTAHQLRHSFATRAVELNVPPKALQKIMGHKQISTTLDIYTDVRESAIQDAGELLSSAFLKKNQP